MKYTAARKIINGTDKAELIAGYAMLFEAALIAGAGRDERETRVALCPGMAWRGVAALGLVVWLVTLIRWDWPAGTEEQRLTILANIAYGELVWRRWLRLACPFGTQSET